MRALKSTVRTDVLEHGDGVWETVYGSSYTGRTRAAPARPADASIGAIQAFTMPGWEWGYDVGLGHLYAQLYRNDDDRDAAPRIRITPPGHVATTVDEGESAPGESTRYGPSR
ncbi:hypothetical protein ACFYY8_18610 [Streptosporangium sp. NPDC001559]|uniref:hypothetical protein n=1 Tax=Streptosporangium sp. NPDC001559 TaxID=3366187 RepID=UPI0036F06385